MFRNRFALALLLAVAILPLVGCADRRCCYPPTLAARPVYAAPDCCPPAGPGAVVVP